MKLGERIRQLVDAKNLTHAWVAVEAGMTPTAFSRIINGSSEDPSFFTVLRIAQVIREPISAIAGDAPNIWSNAALERLRADTAWTAAEIRSNEAAPLIEVPAPSRRRTADAQAFPAAADSQPGLEPESFEHPRKRIPAGFRKKGADAVFSVIGDSMTGAGYHDGDLVYVASTREVRAAANKVVIATLDGIPLLKKLTLRGRKIVLESAHPAHKPIEVDEDEQRFRLRGIVVGRTSPRR
jgi:SOS-response transcriptional repressor LexA